IDDLAHLSKETVMAPPNAKDLNNMLTPFADRHISPSEKESLKASIDREQVVKGVDPMMTEALALLEAGTDPTSPADQDFARRWLPMFRQIKEAVTASGTSDKARAVWNDALDDPATAEKLALHRRIFAFVDQAVTYV